MDSSSRAPQNRHAPAPRVLGDLLPAGTANRPPPEADWVRLVRSIGAGDSQALHVLFTRMHRIVFTMILRIVHDRASAEEVTLDVFHDVWRRAPAYDPAGGPVIGWILNQARSRAIDRVRLEQRKKRVPPPGDDASPVPPAIDPQDAFDLREQGRLLQIALTGLTPNERQAIEVAFLAGLTHEEVATRLNQPLGTVKTRIRSGLGKLRQTLSERLKES